MKKLIFLCVFPWIFFHVSASEIDSAIVRKVATNFLNQHFPSKKVTSLMTERVVTDSAGNNLFYIFTMKQRDGFIIASADDQLKPVLAYSLEQGFSPDDEKPPAFTWWYKNMKQQAGVLIRGEVKGTDRYKLEWDHYIKNVPVSKGIADAGPLLTVKWNQGRYYNTLCPETSTGGSDGHVWVGCVAVAMGQVMKYWNYPDYGSGEHSYNHATYGTQSADFAGTYYDWAAMPDALSGYNTPVATLLYHCGVSLNMNYGPSGSGAFTSGIAYSLKTYFDYSRDVKLVYRSVSAPQVWDSLLRAQIDLGQPMAYRGGSHAFNVDGYQGEDYFHINWGWGGSYNGYFYMDDLTPGSYDFTSGQAAVINIKPNCGEAPMTTDTITEYSGTIYDNGGSWYNYLNCSDSRILIAPESATHIFLEFTSFHIAEGDTLFVYDGASDSAPLLYALTGDSLPQSIMTSAGMAFLRFVSGDFTTSSGYAINFTASFRDAGVIDILQPLDRTCGRSSDSVIIVLRNYGIDTLVNIPVQVNISGPGGGDTLLVYYTDSLPRNVQDTIFAGGTNTTQPGDYLLTAYTAVTGDTLINENDSAMKEVHIKVPGDIPFYESVDELKWDMGDWKDKNWATWINQDPNRGNAFFSAWVDSFSRAFFIYDRKLHGISPNSVLSFDYRIMNGMVWPPVADTLNLNERFHVIVSKDCGYHFDTIFTIDMTNHHPDSLFRRLTVPLVSYAGEDIIFGFTTEWDSVWAEIDLDNIVVADILHNNTINAGSVCAGDTFTISGSAAEGGLGLVDYRWQKSVDDLVWEDAPGINNQQNYHDTADVPVFYRRIARDTLFPPDTSNTIRAEIISRPVVTVTADTTVCAGDPLILVAGGGESYLWSSGESDSSLLVIPVSDQTLYVTVTNGGMCSTEDSVVVSVYPLPEPELGADTLICSGDSITLYPGSFSGWMWNTGSADSMITVSEAGIYKVSVTNEYGCQAMDSVRVDVNVCAGIRDIDPTVRVYPNPVGTVLTIVGTEAFEKETTLQIIDMHGRVVWHSVNVQDVFTIHTDDWKTGLYLLLIRERESVQKVKIIKE